MLSSPPSMIKMKHLLLLSDMMPLRVKGRRASCVLGRSGGIDHNLGPTRIPSDQLGMVDAIY